MSSSPPILGEFRLGRQLTTTLQIIITGLTTFTGLLFLISGPLLTMAGARSALAVAGAAVVFTLTLANVFELLGGSGARGGTYPLVRDTLGGLWGFLTGWSVVTGSLAMGSALLRAASRHTAQAAGLPPHNTSAIALGLLAVMLVIHLFQIRPRRTIRRVILLFLLTLLTGALLSALPQWQRAPAPQTSSDFGGAVAWLMAGYVGFEALLALRRQIQEPKKRLPPALLGALLLGSLILAAPLWIAAHLPPASGQASAGLAETLAANSLLPGWLIHLLAAYALYLAASTTLTTAVRQMNAFAREGALPSGLRRVFRPFATPPGLFALLGVLTAPLTLLISEAQLIALSAGMFLVAMTALNAAAIHSQRTEPDRRRTFVVPFAPLMPSIAIGLGLLLMLALPARALQTGLLWLGVGALFYYAYARPRQTAAHKGEIVFGRARPQEKKGMRILVPLGQQDDRRLVLTIAASLARQWGGEVIPLQIIPVPDPLAITEGRRLAEERNTLFGWSTRLAETTGVRVFPLTRLARSVPEGIIDTAEEESCDLVLLSWGITEQAARGRLGAILDPVARGVTCDLAIVAYHPEKTPRLQPDGQGLSIKRVLVPTAGGPHAPLAIRLALLLTREHEAAVTACYVARPEATPEDIAVGEARIQQTVTAMREQESALPNRDAQGRPLAEIPIEGQVIPAHGVVAGITEAGDACDLVFIGASEESLIDQVLFGSIPEQVARMSSKPVIMVKRYRGLPRFWLHRTWNALIDTLPQVSPQQQAAVQRTLLAGARPSVDFFVLIGLSTLIATFGLLQSSAAVIIGAMLVAPLFTPLMALSLSIVSGDVRLLRLAVESSLKGTALAIGLAFFMALVFPFGLITPEILARTQPTLLDLGVALAAGVVGGYAVARREVAAALPGVAIAAALVPPLGVIGIGLGFGDLQIAGAAGLLIATNLIAIVGGGAVTLLLLGFRPARGRGDQLRRGLMSALVLFLLITAALGGVTLQSATSTRLEQHIQTTVVEQAAAFSAVELVSPGGITFEQTGETLHVTVPVYLLGEGADTVQVAAQIAGALEQALDAPVRVRLVVFTVVEAEGDEN